MNKIVFKNVKDLNTEHIFECGQCFRWNRCEPEVMGAGRTELNGAATTIASPEYIGVVGAYVCKAKCVRSEVNDSDSDESRGATSIDLVLETTGGDREFWREYFDLNTDYSEIKHALIDSEADRKNCGNMIKTADESGHDEENQRLGMRAAAEYGYGIRILNQDIFETIISFIISQNNNIPRIKKCIEAVCSHYGEPLGEVFGEKRFAFPSAEVLSKVPVCELADLKLGYRCSYIVEAAKKFMAEGEPENYDDVLAYFGIGPKVANCIMLFGLHRVDAFPIDTWVKHIMSDIYGFAESDVRGMAKFAAERFGNYAGYAQQYLFYYYRDKKM